MKNAAFDVFARKVSLFDTLVKQGHKDALTEAQTRLEYIDPMLRALGWDVSNEAALNQFDREILVEEAIEGGEVSKIHPDYTFRSGGQPLFYLEAKRPSVDIRNNPQPSLQIRRYVWSSQLPAGVLTDFEELSIYDGRIAPRATDAPRIARSFCRTYDQYLDDWSLLWERLSRDAVLGGSLREYGPVQNAPESAREPFDRAFLADLDRWRLMLADALRRRNTLDQEQLNASTQTILNRLIFLRVAEARGVQPRGTPTLEDAVARRAPYESLLELFRQADDRYNSGLFHFQDERGRPGTPDDLTPALSVPDATLRQIVAGLYPPTAPYDFATVPSDLLGSVYERFLGKELTLRPGGKLTLEVKPELRKAGGVFYTPTRIVRHMVSSTIGRWLAEHKRDDIRSIRVCDPACGSGAFLVAAFEFLVAEHIRRYLRRRDTRERYLVETSNRTFTLIPAEKKRILTTCIFGIDIDGAAVEITKLSLLLAALEGETRESVDRQLGLFAVRALPDIDQNVICANSLIGAADLDLTDLSVVDALRPLNWSRHPSTAAGFDVLLGNPPYVFGEWHHPVQLRILRQRLQGIRQIDLYHAFVDMVIGRRKPDGYWSLIIPDAILARDDTAVLRRALLASGDLSAMHVGEVFEEAGVSCVVLTQGPARLRALQVETLPEGGGAAEPVRSIPFDLIEMFEDVGFRLGMTTEQARLLAKIAGQPRTIAGIVASITRGEEFGKGELARAPARGFVPCVVGEDLQDFSLNQPRHFIPKAAVVKAKTNYAAGKAVTIKTGTRPRTAIDRVGYVTLQSVYNINPAVGVPIEFVAAILNSRIAAWYIRTMYTSQKKLFPQMNQRHIATFPAPGASLQGRISKAVLLLERAATAQQAEFLRDKVEDLISDAYGLTPAERAIVEAD